MGGSGLQTLCGFVRTGAGPTVVQRDFACTPLDAGRVREALAKLKAVHFPELEIDVFFERKEAVQEMSETGAPVDGVG